MLDYHAQVAALERLRSRLDAEAAAAAPDPKLVALRDTVQTEWPSALLGALLDHMIEHAQTTEAELAVLKRASDTWVQVGRYLAAVAEVRVGLQALVLDPGQPGALDRFNVLATRLQDELKPKYDELMGRLKDIYGQLFAMKYIPPHGQAEDAPVASWPGRDLLQARRTGALSAGLIDAALADGSDAAMAFAYGALSRYAANVAGTPYVNNVVRGPRRSHPHRNRTARYTVGAWLRDHLPGGTMPLATLASAVRFGSPLAPTLPPAIKAVALSAWSAAYGAVGLATPPDLDKGYANLLEHLRLLTSFAPLPVPLPIDATLKAKIVAQQIQSNPSGPPGGVGSAPPASDANSNSNPFDDIPWWAWVLFGVCIALVAACYLTGLCAPAKKDPYPGPFQGPDEQTNAGQLKQYLTSDEALASVKTMFDLHCQLYSAAVQSLYVLKLLGLVYPDEIDLGDPNFAQFTRAIPEGEIPLPRRPIAQPDRFLAIPLSDPELPSAIVSHFGTNATPDAFLSGPVQAGGSTLETYGFELWATEATGGESEIRSINRDLDGDRGELHACWQVTPGQSIADNPVPVDLLGYNRI